MRIQIISHNREKNPDTIKMRWHWLPLYFEEFGHEVDHVFKQDWKYFYLRYLKFKPDVLISVGPIAFIPSLMKKMRLIRAPHVHDWTDDNVDINGKEHGITKMALYEYFTVENADYITTPSVFKKERCELWDKPVFYVPHGVNPDFDEVEPAELEGNVKILYSGEQSRRKRVDRLNDVVTFLTRPIPNHEMPALYAECDLYVQPSIVEPYGIAVLEAMACGKPVVGTGVGGMLDTVEDGETGFLVESMDSRGLAEQIIMLSDPGLRGEFGRAARERMEGKFDWRCIADGYLEVIDAIG